MADAAAALPANCLLRAEHCDLRAGAARETRPARVGASRTGRRRRVGERWWWVVGGSRGSGSGGRGRGAAAMLSDGGRRGGLPLCSLFLLYLFLLVLFFLLAWRLPWVLTAPSELFDTCSST
ncbi:hypothetical protein PICMEDRAFT_172846 [Pichia membranifaciens NRRL Y-2026]|uniref:Uncharacterized protein n=1 Tax=Pichia membranifaciens NRRL Y-2026 TaxID=763406 RepID=A0A1E3NH64_9ASCO|nr:hypothetical protein PICMEDRAFT_172846 [Pichia membranifaciens NRRL Y-2026]ODQ45459.1 hypothetical protein PICMEDRAFT_172846 [Pichia membranifaciens NRRL Y-2026]